MSTSAASISEQSAGPVASSLPAAMYLSSFVGRKNELRRIDELIRGRGARLITLTGPSGVGKTRTALHAAERLSAFFDHTVWFVELGAVDDADLLAPTIAGAIGVPSSFPGPPAEAIAQHIGDRRGLLVLDNFEHVIDAAPLLATLLFECPELRIMTTSQAVLRITGEFSLAIGPLPMPETQDTSLDALDAHDASRLFLARARAIRDDFGRNEADAASIAEIVRRLDGIPLALEIAASRANVLMPAAMLARLDEGLLDFSDSSVARPRRQQTLRSAIAWSYSLLSPREQEAFRRLSVFRGGFNLESGQAVVWPDASYDFLDVLSTLVDRSLVRRLSVGASVDRFGILSAPREFAREVLADDPDACAVRERHFDWFLRLAEQSESELLGRDQAEWTERLAQEQGNLRAALAWSIERRETDRSLALAAALWRFWSIRGAMVEARGWLSQALALPETPSTGLRAKALHHLGNVALELGDLDWSREMFQQSHDLVLTIDDRIQLGRTHNGLGLVSYSQGRYDEAAEHHEKARQIRHELGDVPGLGNSLTNLGDVALATGDLVTARRFHEEALQLRQHQHHDLGVAYALFNLGVVSFHEGHYDRVDNLAANAQQIFERFGDPSGLGYVLCLRAKTSIEQQRHDLAAGQLLDALEARTSIDNKPGIFECLEEIVVLTVDISPSPEAATLMAAAARLRKRFATPMPPVDHPRYDARVSRLRETLGASAFEDASSGGALLTLEEAVDLARRMTTGKRTVEDRTEPAPATAERQILSPREREVLRLAAQGLTDQQIADQLFMSRRTATTHQANIRQKLGVQNRAEAVAFASREGII